MAAKINKSTQQMASSFKPVVIPNPSCIRCKHFVPNKIFTNKVLAEKFALCKKVQTTEQNYDAEKQFDFEYAYIAFKKQCKGELFEVEKEKL